MSSRPTYSDEFKADAVDLVISSGRSPASVAPELGISVTARKRWVQLHRAGEAGPGGKPYCGVVTTRSSFDGWQRGRPIHTIRARPPERSLIQRAAATLRHPTPITRSGCAT